MTRKLEWKVVPDFYIATTLQVEKIPVNLDSEEPAQFKKADGEIVTVTHSLSKVALLYLIQKYPQRLSFKKLYQYVSRHLPKSYHKLTSREIVAKELLHIYCYEAIEFYVDSSPYVTTPSAFPLASPLARVLAAKERQQPLINLRCEFIHLSPTATALLPHLTGKNNRPALLEILPQIIENPAIKPINLLLDDILVEIAQGGLLVA